MENDGQLTFSDDTIVIASNEALSYMETGDFTRALDRIDPVVSSDPDHPGLSEIYRTARFWITRIEEASKKPQGKDRANFLMDQWTFFTDYTKNKGGSASAAYIAARKFIFFSACEEYKEAFRQNENPTEKFENLINLGVCFITLGEYRNAIETLEYARSSHRSDARLISLLAESYYHAGDIPKSLLLFREAFSTDPAQVDLSLISAPPIKEIEAAVRRIKPLASEIREWIPVIGYVTEIFYVKRQINTPQFETIKRDVLSLERSFQSLSHDQRDVSNVTPRLLNKYLWLYDYFAFQSQSTEHSSQIRDRLCAIDAGLFTDFFKRIKK
jgi:tetratricopeptide (TPR) repeat protein